MNEESGDVRGDKNPNKKARRDDKAGVRDAGLEGPREVLEEDIVVGQKSAGLYVLEYLG